MIQNCFENIKPSKRVLGAKDVGKHKLVDSADAYKDGDWQEIRCT